MSMGFSRESVAPRWFLFLAWLITRRAVLKPIYRSVVCNDLLGQAEHLRSSGYYVASVALTRCWLERAVNRLTILTPGGLTTVGPKQAFGNTIQFLVCEGVIDAKLHGEMASLYATTSKVVHGKETNARKSFGVITSARGIRKNLERATIAMLSRTNEDEGDASLVLLEGGEV